MVGASWKCRARRRELSRRSPSEPSLGPARSQNYDGGPLTCELCLRESPRFTSHHLVPRSRGGRDSPRARLCPTCHRQLHAMFSESTLAKELNSVQALRSNPEFSGYLKWARRQKGPTNFRVRRAKNRR
ncbi:MAG TPA: hypothetical protein DIT90_06575 [Dehalococcoidia bacterium]|nr:hypothetical protein [Dehalococcoidia bacterium]